ncbi:MAG: hypothetical protein K8S94_13615 [Planctomycetia bacterium]|nr:hypothetical protein [Planctomycetia bacterium]
MNAKIHQIYYRDDQKPLLDQAFIPYDNTANSRPEWREYHVFRTEFLRGDWQNDTITGYVSWKFGSKTETSGAVFKQFIQRNPGYDVYFINPAALVPRRFANIWLQGDFHHPGLIEITEAVLQQAGMRIDLAQLQHDVATTLCCNYWAGTAAFWRKYMAFCEPVFQTIEHHIDPELKARIDRRADKLIDACYRPFIMERLFTTLLSIDRSIRWLGYRKHTSAWKRWLAGQAS